MQREPEISTKLDKTSGFQGASLHRCFRPCKEWSDGEAGLGGVDNAARQGHGETKAKERRRRTWRYMAREWRRRRWQSERVGVFAGSGGEGRCGQGSDGERRRRQVAARASAWRQSASAIALNPWRD